MVGPFTPDLPGGSPLAVVVAGPEVGHRTYHMAGDACFYLRVDEENNPGDESQMRHSSPCDHREM